MFIYTQGLLTNLKDIKSITLQSNEYMDKEKDRYYIKHSFDGVRYHVLYETTNKKERDDNFDKLYKFITGHSVVLYLK